MTSLERARDLVSHWRAVLTARADTLGSGRGASGRDLTVARYGSRVRLALRTARALETWHRVFCRGLDLRWLAPLPTTDALRHARPTGRLLVVAECRPTDSAGGTLATARLESRAPLHFARVAGAESFVPSAAVARLVMPQEHEVVAAARRLVEGG